MMSSRAKASKGSERAKKARLSQIENHKWTDGQSVVILAVYSTYGKSCIQSVVVPRSALPELLAVWLDKRMENASDDEAPTCDIDLDDDDNEQLLEYLKEADVNKFFEDCDEEDDEENEEDEEDDGEIDDTSDLMEHINTWVAYDVPKWVKNRPAPNVAIKISAYFHLVGEA